jgi:hypothetical protein
VRKEGKIKEGREEERKERRKEGFYLFVFFSYLLDKKAIKMTSTTITCPALNIKNPGE